MMKDHAWYKIEDSESVVSPSLLVYPDRIEKNIQTMIKIAGGAENLRPHIKTYKIAEIIKLQISYSIDKFKCATIAEAELLAKCKAKDILLAMQPVGLHITRFFDLIAQYPGSQLSAIVDNHNIIDQIAAIAAANKLVIALWLDINNGMNRTGIKPGKEAEKLYQKIDANPNLIAKGLHVYDGHIHEPDFDLRKKICDDAFDSVIGLKSGIEKAGIKIKTIVAGGSPSFPIHAMRKNVELSPGTTLLWDQGYLDTYQDLKFLPAAVLLGRISSKPVANYVCLDLGHKSVAAEMDFPRVKILNFNNSKQISHSEEHLVIESNEPEKYDIGGICYATPTHICPTVAKYKNVLTVVKGKITGSWEVVARDHKINI